jgi:hypothetical protein
MIVQVPGQLSMEAAACTPLYTAGGVCKSEVQPRSENPGPKYPRQPQLKSSNKQRHHLRRWLQHTQTHWYGFNLVLSSVACASRTYSVKRCVLSMWLANESTTRFVYLLTDAAMYLGEVRV